jgi:hypothetical protein
MSPRASAPAPARRAMGPPIIIPGPSSSMSMPPPRPPSPAPAPLPPPLSPLPPPVSMRPPWRPSSTSSMFTMSSSTAFLAAWRLPTTEGSCACTAGVTRRTCEGSGRTRRQRGTGVGVRPRPGPKNASRQPSATHRVHEAREHLVLVDLEVRVEMAARMGMKWGRAERGVRGCANVVCDRADSGFRRVDALWTQRAAATAPPSARHAQPRTDPDSAYGCKRRILPSLHPQCAPAPRSLSSRHRSTGARQRHRKSAPEPSVGTHRATAMLISFRLTSGRTCSSSVSMYLRSIVGFICGRESGQ